VVVFYGFDEIFVWCYRGVLMGIVSSVIMGCALEPGRGPTDLEIAFLGGFRVGALVFVGHLLPSFHRDPIGGLEEVRRYFVPQL
jgi:hypothetical protein